MNSTPLFPVDVLCDLFGEEAFIVAIMAGDDAEAALMAVRRLVDAGFVIVPTEREDRS
jgi:hypothetical protein